MIAAQLMWMVMEQGLTHEHEIANQQMYLIFQQYVEAGRQKIARIRASGLLLVLNPQQIVVICLQDEWFATKIVVKRFDPEVKPKAFLFNGRPSRGLLTELLRDKSCCSMQCSRVF